MNVLVTGASGQLGSELRELSQFYKNHDFIFKNKDELDITDLGSIGKILNNARLDFIVNCAAYTAVDKAESEPELAEKVNVGGARNLSLILKGADTRLIHLSTSYVFDGKKSGPYREEDETNPLSVYGRTKRDGENEILENISRAIILRVPWLYSKWLYLERGKNFVKTILRRGRERKELDVVCDQLGNPTYAGDLAKVIMDIIEEINSNPEVRWEKSQIYHYANEGVASWYDFAKAIVEFAGIDCRINPITTADYQVSAPRPANNVLSTAKIKKCFNITIPCWRDSLKLCINSIKENK